MAFSFFHKNDLPQNKQVQDLPIAQLHPNRYQPRRTFSEESIKQLAQTLDEGGLLQPIVVREDGEGYEIVAGERRYRAAKSLGWEKIPAIVNNLSDAQTASLALIENLQRENLNPIDEALAYQELMKINNLTQTQLAQNIGKSQSYVANKLRLLKTGPERPAKPGPRADQRPPRPGPFSPRCRPARAALKGNPGQGPERQGNGKNCG